MVDSVTVRFPGPVAPNMVLCTLTGHLHFGLICPKDILLKVFRFVQMQLCKPKLCCHVLFGEKRPSYVFNLFLILLSSTLRFSMMIEACRVRDVIPGFSAISLSITQSDLVVNLLGRPPYVYVE